MIIRITKIMRIVTIIKIMTLMIYLPVAPLLALPMAYAVADSWAQRRPADKTCGQSSRPAKTQLSRATGQLSMQEDMVRHVEDY